MRAYSTMPECGNSVLIYYRNAYQDLKLQFLVTKVGPIVLAPLPINPFQSLSSFLVL